MNKFGIESFKRDYYSDFPFEITLTDSIDLLTLKEVAKNYKDIRIRLESMSEGETGECEILKTFEKKGIFRKRKETYEIATIRGVVPHLFNIVEYSEEAIPIISDYLEKKYNLKPEDKNTVQSILKGRL